MKIRQCNVPYGNHSDFEYKTFLQPPKTSWPAYSWVWNVNVTREGIMQQMDEFCKSKIKVVYVLPEPREFRPEDGCTLDGYLQESYMELYRFACEYAMGKGMQVWLYDEGGWPSGSANGAVVLSNPALEKKCYAERVVTLQPGAAYVKPADAVGAFFTDYTPVPDGYMPKEEEKICEYFIKVGHYTHMPFPDLLNPESTKAFLRCTHDRYVAAMGDLIGEDFRVVFTDEPTIASTVWTDDLEERFEEKYGYSYLPYLPAIVKRVDMGEESRQARIDYCNLCGELFAQRYFQTIQDWCKAHGLLFGGHIDDDDETLGCLHGNMHVMRMLRCMDIPGIDTIWRQIFPKERDMTGRRPANMNLFFPRYASSAANQTNANGVLSESYAIYGAGLTYAQMRYVLNFQLIRGINIFNVMNQTYCLDGRFIGGGRPTFSAKMPGATDKAVFHEYAARMSYLAMLGSPERKVALYMPMQDFWACKDAGYAATAFEQTGQQLEKCQVSFDLFDDDVMESCDEAALDKGVVKIGAAAYDTLYFPPCSRVPEATREKLSRFLAGGGKIYMAEGKYNPQIPGAQLVADVDCVAEPIIICSNPHLRAMVRNTKKGKLLFVTNESFESTFATFRFADNRPAYRLDGYSGKVFADGVKRKDGTTEFSREMLSGEGCVWLFTEEAPENVEAENRFSRKIAELKEFQFRKARAFRIEKEGHRSVSLDEPWQTVTTGPWAQYAGRDFSGDGVYATTFAKPAKSGMLCVDLGEVKYSCELFINGKSYGVRCMAPYTYVVAAEDLRENNEMQIRVSNTAANQHVYTDAFRSFTPEELGPYHPIAIEFEKESLESGLLGQVTIWEA